MNDGVCAKHAVAVGSLDVIQRLAHLVLGDGHLLRIKDPRLYDFATATSQEEDEGVAV